MKWPAAGVTMPRRLLSGLHKKVGHAAVSVLPHGLLADSTRARLRRAEKRLTVVTRRRTGMLGSGVLRCVSQKGQEKGRVSQKSGTVLH